MPKDRSMARRLAAESLERGDAVGWHEQVYLQSKGEVDLVPWADMVPNPSLRKWLQGNGDSIRGKKALVIGCGLGDDAEELAKHGCAVTAFDISPTAIEWCKRRFPESPVSYVVADMFAAPEGWLAGFGFVLEAYTLQVLPPDLRAKAMNAAAGFVAPGGTLLVICRGGERDEPEGGMPWPLSRGELDAVKTAGMEEKSFENFLDKEDPPVRRFLAEYRRKA